MQNLPKLSEINVSDRSNLFDYLRTAITHHSNKIEGITLTYGETENLLKYGTTANNKPLDEQLIILGFAKCYDEVIRSGFANIKITSKFIKDLHYLMFKDALEICYDKIQKPIGAYRIDERHITGINIKLSLPHQINNNLENLLYQPEPNDINSIADFHIKFEQIHPFADGNGRIGRLLMTMQYVKNDMIPPLIEAEYRKDYINAMSNLNELVKFLDFSQNESYKIIENKKTTKEIK